MQLPSPDRCSLCNAVILSVGIYNSIVVFFLSVFTLIFSVSERLQFQFLCEGCWVLCRIEELVAPYYIFKEAGAHVDVVSIKGGHVPIGYKFDHFLTSYMITHPSRSQAAIPTMFYQLIKSSVNVCFSCCCFA